MEKLEKRGSMPTKYGVTETQLVRIHLVVEEVRQELKEIIHLDDVWVSITYTDATGKKREFYTEKV